MPSHALPIALVVMSLGLAVGACADDPANPLSNPGFENGDAHWTIDDDTSQVVADAARTGSMGLRIGAERYVATGASVYSSRLPVTPDQQITVTFQAKTRQSNSGVYLWFFDADGKRPPGDKPPMAGVGNADGAWHEYSVEGTPPAGATSVGIGAH